MFTYVTRDIPAYLTASGRPAVPRGINAEGLKRRGFDSGQIRNIREAYRVLYRRGLKLEEALAALDATARSQPELEPFVQSVRDSARGLVR
jgi:UDP-N-acetylglucosamine acyltransferase